MLEYILATMPINKKTAKKASVAKAPPSKKTAARPGATKARAPAKPKGKAPPRQAKAPGAASAELAKLRGRLTLAEQAAGRASGLVEQVKALERSLAAAVLERKAASLRVADLEKRLTSSSAALAAAQSPVGPDPRLAAALTDSAAATQRSTELMAQVASLQADLERERGTHEQAQAAFGGGGIPCPRCRGTMLVFEHRGVTLDRCASCAGLFFDSGELEEVLRHEQHELESAAAEPSSVPGVTAGSGESASKAGFFRSLFARKS